MMDATINLSTYPELLQAHPIPRLLHAVHGLGQRFLRRLFRPLQNNLVVHLQDDRGGKSKSEHVP